MFVVCMCCCCVVCCLCMCLLCCGVLFVYVLCLCGNCVRLGETNKQETRHRKQAWSNLWCWSSLFFFFFFFFPNQLLVLLAGVNVLVHNQASSKAKANTKKRGRRVGEGLHTPAFVLDCLAGRIIRSREAKQGESGVKDEWRKACILFLWEGNESAPNTRTKKKKKKNHHQQQQQPNKHTRTRTHIHTHTQIHAHKEKETGLPQPNGARNRMENGLVDVFAGRRESKKNQSETMRAHVCTVCSVV